MRFVTVTHPQLGTTTVPETRVQHLSEGWTVVEPPATDPATGKKPAPRKRASRARKPKPAAKPTAGASTPKES